MRVTRISRLSMSKMLGKRRRLSKGIRFLRRRLSKKKRLCLRRISKLRRNWKCFNWRRFKFFSWPVPCNGWYGL